MDRHALSMSTGTGVIATPLGTRTQNAGQSLNVQTWCTLPRAPLTVHNRQAIRFCQSMNALAIRPPQGGARNFASIAAVRVLSRNLGNLFHHAIT